ncbi:uncharacterized protein J4E84_008697 [Alternaria hordeiaustralica]|uniref:uncharacterized protein n=2 Tax=Alternaria sect. Infectoriae TaxID=2499258 RepID=UPI0020C46A32|nr:uncharacterized protein J4E84_008697 [Alternaria hordeiaustralica]KAI4678442.1 hypothetical protein J4E84_008697 [Alternaria hordeiaustralica]
MSNEYHDDPSFQPWGPFISDSYKNEPITKADIIIASVVWGLTLLNVILALWLIVKQTKGSRSPLRSVYVWMIWLELIVSFTMGLESFLHLLKYIKPSFAFYFTILFWWCIQVQLLLQIIINRIRVIVPDRRRSRWIMISTAVFVTVINISVFNVWIPARLQINKKYHLINEYWDRIEKGLYLLADAALNWYFLKTVKENLINNGLTKYNKLVRFNQQIVMVSLLMDVMIIAAMSIPNSFVYIQFHPLAYLVKLNIEMTMANLIKRIAISTSRKTGMASIAHEFKSSSNQSTTGHRTTGTNPHKARGSIHELASFASYTVDTKANAEQDGQRVISFAPTGNQIKETREVIVHTEPNPFYERRGSEVEITAGHGRRQSHGVVIEERGLGRQKSLESITEGNESMRSGSVPKRLIEDSDDEAALVQQKTWGWPRRPS